jgi:hypothetical protein
MRMRWRLRRRSCRKIGKYIHGFGILLEFFFVVLFFGLQIWLWAADTLGVSFLLAEFFSFFLSVGFAFVLAGSALRVFENLFSFLVIHTKLGFGFVSYVPPLDAR